MTPMSAMSSSTVCSAGRGCPPHAAAIREDPGQGSLARPCIQESGIQAKDDVGILKARENMQRPPEDGLRYRWLSLIRRFVGVPDHAGIHGLQGFDLAQQRWRGNAPRQKPETRALVGMMKILPFCHAATKSAQDRISRPCFTACERSGL